MVLFNKDSRNTSEGEISIDTCMSNLDSTARELSRMMALYNSSPVCKNAPVFFMSHQDLVLYFFLSFANLMGIKCYIVILICISLVIKKFENLLLYLLALLYVCCLFSFPLSLSKRSKSAKNIANIFPQRVILLLVLSTVYFCWTDYLEHQCN